MMKSLGALMGAVALGGLMAAAPALADGMPSRGARAPVAAPFSWTGFYGGLNVGAVRLQDDAYSVAPADAATAASWGACFAAGACVFNHAADRATGVIGGLQLGYNFQSSNIVFGIEADIQGSTANASRGVFTQVPGFARFEGAANTSLEWLGTVRGRLGLLFQPTVLAYITGGLAYGEVTRTYGHNFLIAGEVAGGRSSGIDTGWTAGAGVEWAITNRVTLGAEYLYVDLDGGGSFRAVNLGPAAPACNAANCNFNVRHGDLDMHIARLKVNYKF